MTSPYRSRPLYTRTAPGTPPITLDDARAYLKIPDSQRDDDAILLSMILTVTHWGEHYCGFDFRVGTWIFGLDSFPTTIRVDRSFVDGSTEAIVTRLVSGVATVVPDSTFYWDTGLSCSHIRLEDGETWPDDADTKAKTVGVAFNTKIPECIEQIKAATLRHLAYLYENRGDCDSTQDAAFASGAVHIYDPLIIPRV